MTDANEEKYGGLRKKSPTLSKNRQYFDSASHEVQKQHHTEGPSEVPPPHPNLLMKKPKYPMHLKKKVATHRIAERKQHWDSADWTLHTAKFEKPLRPVLGTSDLTV
eukprot:CAMPEP_0114631044 /NCGR_PEP_ID=MMETSP0168-20121206/14205_1 /TAXON_ID=95228 ORGANISM="Vannella sp., Strain DIVA3 517/6/12" /NCGR_SAMPLE_ID=MMETSP0168 /ASSEMBLY_ACC=CAM_ASM_000044 /LENGTH=106 /DNA_ID=CAMNT_0001842589 /DNA_START=37 /DNA_END=357 /DNA_ORIENTATION=-